MYNMEEFFIQVMTTDGIVYRERLKNFLTYFFKTSTVYIDKSGSVAGSALENLLDLFDDLKDDFSYYEVLRAYLLFHNENRLCFSVPWDCLL